MARPPAVLPPPDAPGAARLVEALERLGVEVVFGLPGVHNLPIWKALARSPIRLVGVRHEQAAAYAADGYARATGRLGVALVTTGPGAANTLAAVGEAMASGSPVLVIATDIPAALRRPGVHRGVLHETRDQTAMFASVTKARRLTDGPAEIGPAVLESAATALAAPTGPVYLGVPTDELSQAAPVLPEAPVPPGPDVDGPSRPGAETQARPGLSPPALEAAVALLATAERPLIWAGGGALRSGAGQAVGRLAVALAAPVVTTYQARGLLPPQHPCTVPGPVHEREVGGLWDEADVVVAIGTDFDGMMTQKLADARPAAAARRQCRRSRGGQELPGAGHARRRCARGPRAARPACPAPGGRPGLERRLGAVGDAVAASVTADDAQAATFLGIMERVLPDDAVVVADMCIPGYWLAGYRRVPLPRKLAYPVGWGTLGFAFPPSLGTALAGAGPAVCVTGDGGFLFACGELATVAHEKLSLTVVLVDDGGYGMLRFDQEHAGDERFGVDLVRPDFAALARCFGVAATTVDGFGAAFEHALEQSIGADAAHIIVVDAHLKPPRPPPRGGTAVADRRPPPRRSPSRRPRSCSGTLISRRLPQRR